MNYDSLKKLLLSENKDDNLIAMEIIISKSKDYDDIRAYLAYTVGFDGMYLKLGWPLRFGEKTADLLLNNSFTNERENKETIS